MKRILRFIPGRALGLAVAAGLVISAFTSVAVAALSQEEQVAAARRDWLIGVATEKRIAAELARYQASDQTSPEVITLYETYLDRVHRLTEEKRRVLEQLDAERGRRAKAPPSTQGTPGRSTAEVYDPQIPEDQTLDQVLALDQELERSLAAFDDMLLRENEQSRVQSELKMQKLAREAAQAAKSLREQGQMEGSAETASGSREGQSSDGSGNETGEMQNDREGSQQDAEAATGEQDDKAGQETTGEGTDLAKGRDKQPQSTASGDNGPPGDGSRISTQDDDIVARQLREAAEKETDPELKAKLWKEYHDYKKSI
jgi:hypothetical protein